MSEFVRGNRIVQSPRREADGGGAECRAPGRLTAQGAVAPLCRAGEDHRMRRQVAEEGFDRSTRFAYVNRDCIALCDGHRSFDINRLADVIETHAGRAGNGDYCGFCIEEHARAAQDSDQDEPEKFPLHGTAASPTGWRTIVFSLSGAARRGSLR